MAAVAHCGHQLSKLRNHNLLTASAILQLEAYSVLLLRSLPMQTSTFQRLTSRLSSINAAHQKLSGVSLQPCKLPISRDGHRKHKIERLCSISFAEIESNGW